MSFDSMLARMRAEAQKDYADGYLQEVLSACSEYSASIFSDFEQALKGTPYKVIVTGNGRMAFEHASGHVVTSNRLSIRKPPVVTAERRQPMNRWNRLNYSAADRA